MASMVAIPGRRTGIIAETTSDVEQSAAGHIAGRRGDMADAFTCKLCKCNQL